MGKGSPTCRSSARHMWMLGFLTELFRDYVRVLDLGEVFFDSMLLRLPTRPSSRMPDIFRSNRRRRTLSLGGTVGLLDRSGMVPAGPATQRRATHAANRPAAISPLSGATPRRIGRVAIFTSSLIQLVSRERGLHERRFARRSVVFCVRAVRIPLPRSHPTAGGVVAEAPLVLVDLVTAVRRYLVE
ncbi:MAG: hypothetical protein QOG89_3701 [Thermomicrobiales bacterium]|nr:hypothetical protein [Thermomicrobiales bacterium]